jgi:hypothetical protein
MGWGQVTCAKRGPGGSAPLQCSEHHATQRHTILDGWHDACTWRLCFHSLCLSRARGVAAHSTLVRAGVAPLQAAVGRVHFSGTPAAGTGCCKQAGSSISSSISSSNSLLLRTGSQQCNRLHHTCTLQAQGCCKREPASATAYMVNIAQQTPQMNHIRVHALLEAACRPWTTLCCNAACLDALTKSCRSPLQALINAAPASPTASTWCLQRHPDSCDQMGHDNTVQVQSCTAGSAQLGGVAPGSSLAGWVQRGSHCSHQVLQQGAC